jgi:ribose transport system permease protein
VTASVQDVAPTGAPPAARRAGVVDLAFVPVLIVAMLALFYALSPTFLTGRNVQQLLISGAVLGILAAGATFVIICGELDLSSGAVAAVSGVVAGYGMTTITRSTAVGVLLGLACGLGFGLVNGLITTLLKVPSFVTTLGVMVAASGLALVLTSGATVADLPDSLGALANTSVLGVRSIVWIMLGVFAASWVLLSWTGFGIRTYAIGGNREAARLAGIAVGRIRVVTFVISGLFSGVAGVLLAARVQSAQPTAGADLTLYAIAAVILGGTSLTGGRGSVLRTLLGVLLIAVVKNGLDNLGLEYSYQNVVVGAVFVLAASSEILRRRRR